MWLSPGRAQVGVHVNVPKAPMLSARAGTSSCLPSWSSRDGPPWGEPVAGAFLHKAVRGAGEGGQQLAGIGYNSSVTNAMYGNKLSNNGISPEGDFFFPPSELVSEMVFCLV